MAADIRPNPPTYTVAAGPIGGVEFAAGIYRRISWAGIFAGVVVVLAIQLLLAMLGLGVGLSLVNPTQGTSPEATSFGIGAGLWWTISYLIAVFAGGYVAARLAGRLVSWDGALHGILTWAFTLLVTFYLLGTAIGSVIGGAFSLVGNTVSTAGQSLKSVVPEIAQSSGLSADQIQQRAKDLLSAQPNGADAKSLSPQQAQEQVAANLPRLAIPSEAPQARQRITAIVAAQLNISPDDAGKRLDDLTGRARETAQQVGNTARQTADKTASGAARASFLAFIGLVLGAIAAAWGGNTGVRRRADEVAA